VRDPRGCGSGSPACGGLGVLIWVTAVVSGHRAPVTQADQMNVTYMNAAPYRRVDGHGRMLRAVCERTGLGRKPAAAARSGACRPAAVSGRARA
jgi:hypothetical protein